MVLAASRRSSGRLTRRSSAGNDDNGEEDKNNGVSLFTTTTPSKERLPTRRTSLRAKAAAAYHEEEEEEEEEEEKEEEEIEIEIEEETGASRSRSRRRSGRAKGRLERGREEEERREDPSYPGNYDVYEHSAAWNASGKKRRSVQNQQQEQASELGDVGGDTPRRGARATRRSTRSAAAAAAGTTKPQGNEEEEEGGGGESVGLLTPDRTTTRRYPSRRGNTTNGTESTSVVVDGDNVDNTNSVPATPSSSKLNGEAGNGAAENALMSPGNAAEARAGMGWTDVEDVLLIFLHSERGVNLGCTYETLAPYLGKSPNAVKLRWYNAIRPIVVNRELSKEEYERKVAEGEATWTGLKQGTINLFENVGPQDPSSIKWDSKVKTAKSSAT